jgi:hypothetical protein
MAAKKTTKTAPPDETLTRQIGVRLSDSDYKRLEALSGAMGVSALVRAAIFVGLDAIEAQPGILLGQKPKR